MKTTRMLLPRGFKCADWWILAAGAVLGILYCIIPDSMSISINDIRELFGAGRIETKADFLGHFSADSDLMMTLIGLFMVVGGVFVGFSRNKEDDEFIEQIRYESLLLSIYVNSIALVVCLLFVWGLSFVAVMFCSLFSVLCIFIICFYIRVLFNKKTMRNEE